MKTQVKSIFLALVLGAMTIAASAQPARSQQGDRSASRPNMENGQRGEGRMEMIPRLTEEQKEQMKTIKIKSQQEILPIQNQVREKEAKLKTLQTAAKVDMKAIEGQIDEIAVLKTKVAKIRANAHQNVRAILTDEQRIVMDTKFVNGRDRNRKGPRGRGNK